MSSGGIGSDGSSSSSSHVTTTTNNYDKRMVLGDNGLAVSSDSSTVTVNALDGGAIKDSYDFAFAAGDAASQGFDKLLKLADKLFTSSYEATANTQALTAAAYQTAEAERKGNLDNKTITILAAVAAVAFVAKKKG